MAKSGGTGDTPLAARVLPIMPDIFSTSRLRLGRLAVLPLVLAAAACGDGTGPNNGRAVDSLTALPRQLSAAERQGIDAGNAFALNLLRRVAAPTSEPTKNVLLSPLSVSMALGLTMNGAAGTTLSEMQQVLGWGTRTRSEINSAYRDLQTLLPSLDPTVTVSLANGIWTRRGSVLDTGFVREARDFFRAPVEVSPSPQAMFDAVNAWGDRETKGMVPRVLTQAPPDNLLMILANAVYFSGTWRDRFDPARTRANTPFTLASGATVPVPMMMRTDGFNAGAMNIGANSVMAAELPYGNGAYSMLLLMPQSGSVDALVQQLDTARLGSVVRSLQPISGAEVGVPRFTLSSSRDLSADLMALGMPRAFSDGAEFPRLIVNETEKIGFVQHAVTLEVNERGTRAAAVTAVGIIRVSLPPSFIFDKPFVFAIRERLSGTILFIGVVRDPRA